MVNHRWVALEETWEITHFSREKSDPPNFLLGSPGNLLIQRSKLGETEETDQAFFQHLDMSIPSWNPGVDLGMMDDSKLHGRWNRMTENYGDDPNVFGNPGSRWIQDKSHSWIFVGESEPSEPPASFASFLGVRVRQVQNARLISQYWQM